MCSRSSGFGIGYGIGRKYRPIRVSVSVSDRNQNSGFGRSLIYTVILEGEVVGTAARYLHTSGKLTARYMGSFGP